MILLLTRIWQAAGMPAVRLLWGFFKANPTIGVLLLVTLVSTASAWWWERTAHEATRVERAAHEAQYQETIRGLSKVIGDKQKEVSQLKGDRVKLVTQIEQAQARLPVIQAEHEKIRKGIAALHGREIEAAFKRRGY